MNVFKVLATTGAHYLVKPLETVVQETDLSNISNRVQMITECWDCITNQL